MSEPKPGLLEHLRRAISPVRETQERGPQQPRGLPMTSDVVSFVAYCARTRTPFVVLARRKCNRLHWIGSTLLPDNRVPSGSDAAAGRASIEQLQMDASGWKCPVCASRGFWQCGGDDPSACQAFHCKGTTSTGKWLGACGSCECNPADARSVTHFALRRAEQPEAAPAGPQLAHKTQPALPPSRPALPKR